ncbi:glycosyltransferase family 4 protein [Negadavirga shengliensis]|uniref:Glycosyltransferase family 4 protein n=1 Tax=Negadavirga shengliensis TaxID=1389218 RepID=A0ABV9T2X9_9BACT
MMKKKVLIFADYFLPGFKAGGPIRSIQNLIKSTSELGDYYLITRDRDIRDSVPYPNLALNEWLDKQGYKVCYLHRNFTGFMKMLSSIRNSNTIYLNSFFSPYFAILPMFFGLFYKKKIIIAPRGEFSSGALAIKSRKKKAFLYFFKSLKIHRKVMWHATTIQEEKEIVRLLDFNAKTFIAPNLSKQGLDYSQLKKINHSKVLIKKKLLLLFIGRIAEIKNIDYAINILTHVHFPVQLSLYGPLEDLKYFEKCKTLVKKLPPNVSVKFQGEVSYHQTHELFQKHHFLFFPTKGENYSHVIAEALQNGCPVILSDQHPWENLEKWQAGWSIPLDSPKKFLEILNSLSRLNQEDYERHSESALSYWKRKYTEDINMSESLYLKLFNEYDQE